MRDLGCMPVAKALHNWIMGNIKFGLYSSICAKDPLSNMTFVPQMKSKAW